MQKVEQTLTVTVDDITYDVSKMSDQVKQMIGLMDDWRQKEVDVSGELIMVRSAIRDIQNALLAQIRQEKQAADDAATAAAAAAPADTTPAPVAAPADTTPAPVSDTGTQPAAQ